MLGGTTLRTSALIAILMTSCVVRSWPQANPEEQLTVRVTYDDDRKAPANLRVELLSAFGSNIETRTTDGFGSVVFTHLRPARYKLRVSGFGVVTTETAELDLTESGPNATEYVSVKKTTVDQSRSGGLSVLDVSVPAEARKEFDKGADSMEKRDWSQAKEHFKRAIAIYPEYARAYNNLGVTYVKIGDGAAAVESFRNALQFDENIEEANLYLGQFYYDNKDYKQAEPCLQRASGGEPRNPQILLALANTQMHNGETDQALASAKSVHSLPGHKRFAIAHLIAAEILTGRGDNKQVAEEYRQFLEEDPSSPLVPRVKEALSKLVPAASN